MLRDELEEITMKARNQKEYDEIIEKMKDVARLGEGYIYISDISDCVLEKIKNEGILIRQMMLLGIGLTYVLSWI